MPNETVKHGRVVHLLKKIAELWRHPKEDMSWRAFLSGAVVASMLIFIPPIACAQDSENGEATLKGLFLVELGILWVVILVVWPCIARYRATNGNSDASELRGLGLPRGSLRGMLAALVVGSSLLALVYALFSNGDTLQKAASVFGPLAATVLAFYFGSRGSASKPESKEDVELSIKRTEAETKLAEAETALEAERRKSSTPKSES